MSGIPAVLGSSRASDRTLGSSFQCLKYGAETKLSISKCLILHPWPLRSHINPCAKIASALMVFNNGTLTICITANDRKTGISPNLDVLENVVFCS